MLRQSTFVLCGMTLVLTLAAAASATTYTITDLGVIAGNTGNESEAMGVNDSGVVVGDVKITSKSAGYRAAYYTTAGGWHDIGSAIDSAGETFATGINDSGQIAMWNRTNLPVDSYMYTISSGTYVNLGTQPGVANGANPRVGSDSYFPGQYRNPGPVNSSGEVVGTYAGTAGNGAAAFIWNGSSTVAMVTPGTGNGSVYPCGINDAGVVVGAYQAGASPSNTGFYYSGGTVTTINATVPGNGSANPTDPESIGGNYVTGSIYNYDNGSAYQDAFIYTVGQADATDIIPESNSCGYAVNSSGTVVGISTNTSGVNSAFIYSGGTVTNLSTLISGTNPFSSIECANGISDNGEYIVGYGIENSTGDTTAFLLTAVPTPEPTTLLLAASGLIGLLAYAWRKRK